MHQGEGSQVSSQMHCMGRQGLQRAWHWGCKGMLKGWVETRPML